MPRPNLLTLVTLMASCLPTAGVHEPPTQPATVDRGRPPAGNLRLVWSKVIPFEDKGRLQERCGWSTLVATPEGDAWVSLAHHSEVGEGRHALFLATADGQIQAASLGGDSEPEGEVIALRFEGDRVLAASRFRNESDTTVVLSARERVGAPFTSFLTLHATAKVWPLSSDRWLAVGADKPHTMTTWTWDGTGRAHRQHPKGDVGGTPAAPLEVYDVAVDGSSTTWVTRGLQKDDALGTVSAFDRNQRLRWFVREQAFASRDAAFGAAGNLWLAGFAYGPIRPELGPARFPVPPKLPPELHKTYEDQPPPPKGRKIVADPRIYSLFSHAFGYVRMVGFGPDRTIDTESIVDGIVLRYDPSGQLELVRYYPSSAIVSAGPLLPDADGMTAVMHIEGPVPDPLRLHSDIPDGWAGIALLVHYDARGREVWAAPLGEGERVIRQLARTADGYLTIALDEQGRCELSRWRLER